MPQVKPREEDRLRRNGDVLSAAIDEEIVLLNPKSGTYLALDDIVSFVWKHLAAEPSLSALTDALVQEYAGDPSIIRHDAAILIDEMIDLGIVEIPAPQT